MSAKTDRNEAAKARARELGAKLFAEKGYAETTTRELAAAMEVTNGTFYYYFSSKEDLLYEISQIALAEISTAIKDALAGVEGVEDRIHAMIAAHMGTILDSHSHASVLTELQWRALSPERRQEVIGARAAYEAMLRREIAAGQQAGFLRTDSEAGMLTLLLLNLMNWTIFWYRPEHGVSPEGLVAEIEKQFLQGASS
ncbi:TetR/AcrR family transcriptional regulator [soil metagenome]